MKTGIIDVGGGFRDVFGAGVLDHCLDDGIAFDYCIGISAGSANLSSYLAGQRGRNYTFYMEYVFRKEYASFRNYLRTGSYVGLDYAYGTLSNSGGEYPLDYEAMHANPAKFIVVACHAKTGQTVYFDAGLMKKDKYDILKASSSLPVVGPPYVAEGIPCFDGGLADPIPVKKAFADGCDRVVLILTRPVNQPRVQKKDLLNARLMSLSYPVASRRLLNRYRTYNDGVAYARQLEKEGKVLILAPDDLCGMTTLKKSRDSMQRLYDKGYRCGARVREFLSGK